MELLKNLDVLFVSKPTEKGIMGRPKIEIDDKFINAYKEWKERNITATKAMELADMSRTTFYRRVKEYEKDKRIFKCEDCS